MKMDLRARTVEWRRLWTPIPWESGGPDPHENLAVESPVAWTPTEISLKEI